MRAERRTKKTRLAASSSPITATTRRATTSATSTGTSTSASIGCSLRLYEEEEDLSIYFIVDASSSMAFGDGDEAPLREAARAALAYVGLANLDRVAHRLGDRRRSSSRMPATRGKARIFKVFRFLRGRRSPRATTDLGDAHEDVRRAAQAPRPRDRALSDLYDPDGFERGINVLRYNKFEPVRAPRRRPARGATRARAATCALYDCETGDEREVTVTAKVLERYEQALRRLPASEIERFCTSQQVPYFRADVNGPFDELRSLRVFRRGGFLRLRPMAASSGVTARDSLLTIFGAAGRRRRGRFYILKLRRRPVAVPFSQLWEQILRDKEATSLFSQLKRLLSLLAAARAARAAAARARRSARGGQRSSRGATSSCSSTRARG